MSELQGKELPVIIETSSPHAQSLDDRPSLSAARGSLSPAALDELERAEMTSWYSPFKLANAAAQIATSTLLGERADPRLLGAVAAPQDSFDYSDKARGGRGDIWIDYVADAGDGWNSTYTIASLLARPTLEVSGHRLPRGEVLIMGGDQVYPAASRAEYKRRLVKPYAAALQKGKAAPDLFAIPGNHDWYDGLLSFTRLFCQRRTIGAYQTRQSRSYFALKLPHGHWLFGIDIQLESDIDWLQIAYFRGVVRDQMADGDKLILCTAEPDWVTGKLYDPDLQDNLAFLEKALLAERPIRIVARIAGDLHHYRRHASADGVQNIIAGGGGAFLHPTHGANVDRVQSGPVGNVKDYFLKASYPDPAISRKLTWGNLRFGRLNRGFMALPAVIYPCIAQLLRPSAPSIVGALALIGLVVFFTDTHRPVYRVLGGAAHALCHIGAALGIAALASFMLAPEGTTVLCDASGCAPAEVHSLARDAVVMLAAAVGGALLGPLIVGLYLLISLNVFGRHGNEAFSALRIEGYKNFLRIHINAAGLTIYPIGIDRVPTDWAPAAPSEDGPLFAPKDEPLSPHLIEAEPIFVPTKR